MAETTANPRGWLARSDDGGPTSDIEAVIAWSLDEPTRVGEVGRLTGRGPFVVGRGTTVPERGGRLLFGPMRPGAAPEPKGLRGAAISRDQLRLERDGGGLVARRTGKLPVRIDGKTTDSGRIDEGSTVMLGDELLLIFQARPRGALGGAAPAFALGAPDDDGIIGETPAAWGLRDQIAFASRHKSHVAVFGASGVGKELCAAAIHRQSGRRGPLVARNAATLPAGIVDAELFGNARDYPNSGMRERPGLVGLADGGTLFLDEIGELPQDIQAHLLRLLDGGEYHRLGEERARMVNLRVIGATNRDPSELKHDLLARFELQVHIPGLNQRRSDIPHLVRALFSRFLARDGALARFCEPDGTLRLDPLLVEALLRHDYEGNLRELSQLLLLAIAESNRPFLQCTRGLLDRMDTPRASAVGLTRDDVVQALTQTGWNVARAGDALGISRHAVRRLMVRHDIQRGG